MLPPPPHPEPTARFEATAGDEADKMVRIRILRFLRTKAKILSTSDQSWKLILFSRRRFGTDLHQTILAQTP